MTDIICETCTYINESNINESNCYICGEILNTIDNKKKRIMENINIGFELIPTSLFQHSCLYLTCVINNFEFIALIDSGAQTTIMDYSIAKKCDIIDIIDDTYKIKIIGIGESYTYGKIYCQDVLIGDSAIPMSFLILKDSICSVIIGMDILNTHRSVIDIYKKTITFSDKTFNLKTNIKEES